MNDSDRDELLSAYLDNEVTDAERAQVEQWLAESLEFRQLHDELRAVRQELRSLPTHKLDRDLGADVLRRAEREVLAGRASGNGEVIPRSAVAEWWSRPKSRRMWFWPALAAAAALVIALVDLRQDAGERQVARDDGSVRAVSEGSRSELHELKDAPDRVSGRVMARSAKSADAVADGVEPAAATPALGAAAQTAAPAPAQSEAYHLNATPGAAKRYAAPANKPAAAGDEGKNQNGAMNQEGRAKLESTMQSALANRSQLNLIQCEVSPDYLRDNRLDKFLTTNSITYKKLDEAEAANNHFYFQPKQLENAKNAPVPQAPQPEALYAVEATPEQVELIVHELDRDRARVSNLSLGLQLLPAEAKAPTDGAAPPPAPQAMRKEAAAEMRRAKLQQQQPVQIWLRQTMPANATPQPAAEPAPKAEPVAPPQP